MSILESPAALARPLAENMAVKGMLDELSPSEEEEVLLQILEQTAGERGLFDTSYLVESVRSAVVPVAPEEGAPVNVHLFNELAFEGKFLTYSTLRMGHLMGQQSMRALCLTFDTVTLFPHLDSMGEDRLLYVPVLAVHDMVPTL